MREYITHEKDRSILEVCYIALANCAYAIGDQAEARSAIARYDAIQTKPISDIHMDIVRIRVYVADGDYDKARRLLDKYLSDQVSWAEENTDIFYEMNGHVGRVLKQIGDYGKAIHFLNRQLHYLEGLDDPSYTLYWREDLLLDIGFCLDEIGDWETARSAFERVISIGGGKRQADAWYYLGVISLKVGKCQQAIQEFRRALNYAVNDQDRTRTILLAESRAHEINHEFEAAIDCKRRAETEPQIQ
jgi:tetratricopeptide (TPR) repeat protein